MGQKSLRGAARAPRKHLSAGVFASEGLYNLVVELQPFTEKLVLGLEHGHAVFQGQVLAAKAFSLVLSGLA